MGFDYLASLLFLALLLKPFSCQQLNTDGYFVSEFFQKMNLTSPHLFNFSAHVCSWQGIFCDAKQVNVIGLVASGLGLSGSIPDTTIGKLSKLQTLDLSCNKITGFPSDLWSLGSSLKNLNFSNNQISGSLPNNIGNFGLVEHLDFSFNNFSGEIPLSLSSLSRLQTLNLNRNGFERNIPMSIMSCKSLVLIDLSMNRLNGKIPHGFGAAFHKLQSLNLAGNKIQGTAEDFSGFKSLNYLNISMNLFQGSIMGAFQNPLTVMDLSKNQFSGHLPQVQINSTFNWFHLEYLDLSENELSGQIFFNLSNTQYLKHLNLAHNRFSRQNFPKIQALLSVEYLNLSQISLTGNIPKELSGLSNLNTLDLSANHLSGHIPFFHTKKLRILDFSLNNLTGEIPIPILETLPLMESFNFSYNNLTFCSSNFSNKTLRTAFIGSLNSCPIAANPELFKRKGAKNNGLKLALALTFSMVCLLVGLLCLAFGCRKKPTNWSVKQNSYNEDQNVLGPFSFQTDSTTWVADVKQATSVPVVIFEKPLLNFTFADLLSATSHFERGTLIDEGRFGPVYRGFLPGGIHVAVKVLVHGSTMTDQEASKELEHLGKIKHPNLVPLLGYCLAGDQRITIYDYMENGNLQNLLHDLPLGVQRTEDWSRDTWEEQADQENNGIQNVSSDGVLTTWRFRHKIALGTARALAFLHHGCSPPIIHRDVKASSVYLDHNLEPKLSDFGLAKLFGNEIEDNIITRGSTGYVPPEFSRSPNGSPVTPTPKSDVFGFGVILFELITGKKAIGDDYIEERETTLVSWVRGLIKRNEGSKAIDPKLRGTGSEGQMIEALKFGYLCTAELPLKRPSMQQIVGLLKDIEPGC